jgi:hypothetical protein
MGLRRAPSEAVMGGHAVLSGGTQMGMKQRTVFVACSLFWLQTSGNETSVCVSGNVDEGGWWGVQTLERSYLLRINGKVVERPQHMLMRVSVGIHKQVRHYALPSQAAVSSCLLWGNRPPRGGSRANVAHGPTGEIKVTDLGSNNSDNNYPLVSLVKKKMHQWACACACHCLCMYTGLPSLATRRHQYDRNLKCEARPEGMGT